MLIFSDHIMNHNKVKSPGWWGHRFSVSLISNYCSSISSSFVPCSTWCPTSKMNTFAFYCLLFVGSFLLAKNNTLVFFLYLLSFIIAVYLLIFNEKISMLTQLQVNLFFPLAHLHSPPLPPPLDFTKLWSMTISYSHYTNGIT